MINNKVILLTGGTGSFGNELIKLLLDKYETELASSPDEPNIEDPT